MNSWCFSSVGATSTQCFVSVAFFAQAAFVPPFICTSAGLAKLSTSSQIRYGRHRCQEARGGAFGELDDEVGNHGERLGEDGELEGGLRWRLAQAN